jgi:Crp-like helix-turn-helix domain
MIKHSFNNFVLQRLNDKAIARLELRPVALPANYEIEFPGESIKNLFFLEEGMASMTTTFLDIFQFQVALAGTEAVLGASCMMGTRSSLNRVYMQTDGHGFSSRIEPATREFKRGEEFHDLTLRYLQAQFIQSAQTAACAAHHRVEQRLARWLLLCAERSSGADLSLSHEYMADMIGARRSTVSVCAARLQAQNLIRYTRWKIRLLDLDGLEKTACECYRVVRDHLANTAECDQNSET